MHTDKQGVIWVPKNEILWDDVKFDTCLAKAVIWVARCSSVIRHQILYTHCTTVQRILKRNTSTAEDLMEHGRMCWIAVFLYVVKEHFFRGPFWNRRAERTLWQICVWWMQRVKKSGSSIASQVTDMTDRHHRNMAVHIILHASCRDVDVLNADSHTQRYVCWKLWQHWIQDYIQWQHKTTDKLYN